MKINVLLSVLLVFVSLLLSSQANQKDPNLNASPYFKIITNELEKGDFLLLSTNVTANITGPVADVIVQQVYINEGNKPIEAIYVFPASTRAAVYDMTMIIGNRTIKAEIMEKKEAKMNYEKAKKEGKRASLLEQFRPNVFQMSVGNIMPKDRIEIYMKYNEFLLLEEQQYSFIYPTVVGPRFNDPEHADKNSSFVNMPYSKENILPMYNFDIILNINSSTGLTSYDSPSHEVTVHQQNLRNNKIQLKNGPGKEGNRDFIFNYSVSEDQPTTATYLYEHGDENFFLSVLEPPTKINYREIPSREYIFIMDVSGSMRGFPIQVSKKLMKELILRLKPSDRFNVLQFASGSALFSTRSVEANKQNLESAFSFIDKRNGSGGTRLLPALEKAFNLPAWDDNLSRSIVVVTDGYIHVEKKAMEYIATNLGRANLFAFGIGSSVNRFLIEGMAHAGRGKEFVITNMNKAEEEASKFREYIENPVLTNIEVDFEEFNTYDISPSSYPDLMSERPIYVFGKYNGEANGAIIIKGKTGSGDFEKRIEVKSNMIDEKNSAIRYLWARERIKWLDDLNHLGQTKKTVDEVRQLGLKYNLLTSYTSFVAIDQEIVNPNGQVTKIKQPLPLPLGVSNHAVGFELKVEGVSKANQPMEREKLFVHVSGNASSNFKKTLSHMLINDLEFNEEEKRFLNNNTLICSFDKTTKKWTVVDAKNKISPKFIISFIQLLVSISEDKKVSENLLINLLWI